ncbi:MAG: alpha/beta hydrolase [Sphingorhabdus sp.]|jgi:poly(3-hydroxyalkanoate) depolymerase|uniref:alpha/beta fold hydrolase n=2 Tax=Sphingorhabdus sp. TaxID=1902408 RepID=UPI00273F6FFE|nr:alpha/beta fold hydrolase [Sphingorhabdus sp.]MDP4757109.1 alpha/beta hydrolase [Sphingorhabdus sp.]MDP4874300.1 alpha/beta hydrolase [Sphingorhabdus sp.]MDP4926039.1 alpha/beta hydrolase [Sphingorhabdus sp.]
MSKNRAPTFSMETVDGRVLRVAVWRASAPTHNRPILFFNGIGANIEAMAPMAELLDDRDFITFDMPGIGGSPDPVVPYNAILMSRIAALLLDRFEMSVVDVMGVSWGGAMAQQFALQNPARINKLILCATSAGMLMVPGNPAALVKMADPRRYIDPDFMAKHFKTLYGGMVGNKSEHISRITPPSKTGYFYQLMAMMGWTSAPFLPFLKTETLIMMGDDDQIVPLANGKFLNFLIPNSELFVVKNGGHLFLVSHVEESITAIRAFLDRDAGKARKAA